MPQTMRKLKALEYNFRFLVLEVSKQVDDALKVIENPEDDKLRDKIRARDDYIDNMKSLIERKSNEKLLKLKSIDKEIVTAIRALLIITANLERVADHAVNIINQSEYFDYPEFVRNYNYDEFFKEIIKAVKLVEEAFFKKNVEMALEICKSEFRLDKLYRENLAKIIFQLKTGQDTENLVTMLFLIKYLERAGDAILNIGEAIISIAFGEKIKITQYLGLENVLNMNGNGKRQNDFAVESVADTKSGCMVKKVYQPHNDDDTQWAIFKDGLKSKILLEKQNIELWDKIEPGLPPKVIGYNESGKYASLVVEFLNGHTFKDIIINGDFEYLRNIFPLVTDQTKKIWDQTRVDDEIQAKYLNQLTTRLKDVYKVHPGFRTEHSMIGDLSVPSFEELLHHAKKIDRKLSAPFSVLIHGDCNIDNIMFDTAQKRIRYIDVYRSGMMDYVQDVSVFIVSNFRLPVFERTIRQKLNWIIIAFYNYAKNFAVNNHDHTFEARLALGLVRSFVSSTRFELDTQFAKLMFLKATYILDKLISYDDNDWGNFKLSEEIMVY